MFVVVVLVTRTTGCVTIVVVVTRVQLLNLITEMLSVDLFCTEDI